MESYSEAGSPLLRFVEERDGFKTKSQCLVGG